MLNYQRVNGGFLKHFTRGRYDWMRAWGTVTIFDRSVMSRWTDVGMWDGNVAFCCDEVQILGALGGLVAMRWPFWIIGGSPLWLAVLTSWVPPQFSPIFCSDFPWNPPAPKVLGRDLPDGTRKRLQVYLGGGIFRPKPPVFDRSWRSPSKNTVKNSTEDTCSWTRPSKIGKRKVKKNRVFQLFDLNFLVCNIFFCGSAGGRARRRIFEFLDPFSDWFSSFCDSRNTGFYSVFLFSACLTASFKTSKNLVNYTVLCYGVNENIVNTSVFLTLVKKTL